MALEASVVNRLLAGQPDATSSIAAYGIYYRVMQFAFMPVVAASVAVLPFVARLSGERDYAAIRRELRATMLAGAAYGLFVVAPALLLFGGTLASWLAEADTTARLTRMALWLAPLAVLTSIPFQLCRPAFEGLQRGRPGLVMAAVRYVGLTIPLGLLGLAVAGWTGIAPLAGLLGGLIAAGALASGIFLVWMRRALAALELRPSSTPDPAPVT
jgi:Na+-driven multidrug efflux pump